MLIENYITAKAQRCMEGFFIETLFEFWAAKNLHFEDARQGQVPQVHHTASSGERKSEGTAPKISVASKTTVCHSHGPLGAEARLRHPSLRGRVHAGRPTG